MALTAKETALTILDPDVKLYFVVEPEEVDMGSIYNLAMEYIRLHAAAQSAVEHGDLTAIVKLVTPPSPLSISSSN